MPKEGTGRRSRRQSTELDNEAGPSSREINAIGSHRYSPFTRDGARRAPRTVKEEPIMSSNDASNTLRGGIIQNGIRYIMHPLHLLRFCIFGTSSSRPDTSKQVENLQREECRGNSCRKDDREEEARKQENYAESTLPGVSHGCDALPFLDKRGDAENVKQPGKEDYEQIDETDDDMATAEEDSNCCEEQWSTAPSGNQMNMAPDYNNFHRFTSSQVEPMDISLEDHASERTCTVPKVVRDDRAQEGLQRNPGDPAHLRPCQGDRNTAMDEEIALIFQKQCTSSMVQLPCPTFSLAPTGCQRTEQNHLDSEPGRNHSSRWSQYKKIAEDTERDRKRRTSTDFVANDNKKKRAYEEDGKNHRHAERRSQSAPREEKHSSRHDTPIQCRSRSARHSSWSSARSKERSRTDITYRETATQTDYAFSDEDVEMVPVEMKLPEEKISYTLPTQGNPLQIRDAVQEYNYAAFTEDPHDGFCRMAHQRVSSCSTSSTSTDLGFDERGSTSSDADVGTVRWHGRPYEATGYWTCARAPPGFPLVPQNPPLIPSRYPRYIELQPYTYYETMAIVPPAPTPLRHLYYEYPEFMDLPVYVNNSYNTATTLNIVIRNDDAR